MAAAELCVHRCIQAQPTISMLAAVKGTLGCAAVARTYGSSCKLQVSLLLLLLLPCRYVVVVQERGLRSAVQLPEVLGVEYVYYSGTCFEWGMVGWLLQVRRVVGWHMIRMGRGGLAV